ncbi:MULTISPECIES: polysaccharide biosynthesis tyrosine autokinase [unclassified Rhizobium]|uniref:polysaccharide biosynthesis tyrosine autokinase n=1 Tax=unclassified Rhizobium TaxID=2613769 RepID=UPI002414514A|nr:MULTISPECIES: polysaccharide biosynthesis tyrosine autokinase [unclassified Rhizobium]
MLDIEWMLGIARRQWRVVAAAAFLAALAGLLYVMTAVPLYTADISVLLDAEKNQLVEELSMSGAGLEDETALLSQIEVLTSETIGLAVVDKLKLGEDPIFMAEPRSILGTVLAPVRALMNIPKWFASNQVEDDAQARRAQAQLILSRNMSVDRVGKTYVLRIGYTSPSPQMAARIANAIGDAYVVDKLNSKYESTRRASAWLQERIVELRQKALETDLAVQKFRTANGLVSTGSQLVSDQQLSELNTALITAQAETAKARARLDRIQSIVSSGQSDAIVTDVLDSSVSTELRKKYLDSAKLEGEISKKLGPNHVQAVRLRAEMAEYKRLMFEEVNRIAESYRSEVDVAAAREKSLQDSVSKATNISATANETQVQLRELERESDTYRTLYQTFLQRYQEAVQQQSFPVTEARIISSASAPEKASFPRKPLVLALFVVMGAAAGTGVGAFREFRDRFFRTGDQVRDILKQEYLGAAPLVIESKQPRNALQVGEVNPRLINKQSSISDYVLDNPLSAFAETLRSAKIAADLSILSNKCKVIGIVSTLPGEGKSTVSTNFAELLASQGNRTVLIDADLRNPGTTRMLARHAQAGILEILLDDKAPQDVLLSNPRTKLAFLPAVIKHRVPHSSELLISPAMRGLIAKLSQHFDYIIVDLPPIGPVVDARAMASTIIDGFIYVVEWGQTARRVVRHTLNTEPQIASKCLGVILNKVDNEKMKLYRSYGSSEYYHSRYSQYYQEG